MSLDQRPMPPFDPRVYTAGVGEWIALQVASGEPDTSLPALHRLAPERVPPPLIVRRWRSVWPAFDALMREAEAVRAAALMEQTLIVADDSTRLAANAKNAIAARWRMAEALAPAEYGQRRILAGDPNAPLRVGAAAELSDAQLEQLARGADPMLLLGDAAGVSEPGHPPNPPESIGGGLRRGDEGGHIPTDLPAPSYLQRDDEPEGAWLERIEGLYDVAGSGL